MEPVCVGVDRELQGEDSGEEEVQIAVQLAQAGGGAVDRQLGAVLGVDDAQDEVLDEHLCEAGRHGWAWASSVPRQ